MDRITTASPHRRGALVVIAALASACGGGGGKPTQGGTPDGAVTLSATLAAPSVAVASAQAQAAAPGTPLAGYRVYCVTLQSPPVAASATADASGRVTLTFPAANVPFGCFIQDPAGANVASVLFDSGASRAQTVLLTASTDLGTVSVDAANGVAIATMPSTAQESSTPLELACPTGTWVISMSQPCGNGTATIWIAPAPSGGFLTSYTIAWDAACGGYTRSQSGLETTYDTGTRLLTVNEPMIGTCGAWELPAYVVTAAVDATCGTSQVTPTPTQCTSCDGNGLCVAPCGTQTCAPEQTETATRQ